MSKNKETNKSKEFSEHKVKDVLTKFRNNIELFFHESSKMTNKSAAVRARKKSFELERILFDYRRASIK